MIHTFKAKCQVDFVCVLNAATGYAKFLNCKDIWGNTSNQPILQNY